VICKAVSALDNLRFTPTACAVLRRCQQVCTPVHARRALPLRPQAPPSRSDRVLWSVLLSRHVETGKLGTGASITFRPMGLASDSSRMSLRTAKATFESTRRMFAMCVQ
jgi:hypothetical protein